MFVIPVCSDFPWALNTIASKPEHDKATRDLNGGSGIAIVWS
jgi:hypothetical protein